MERRELYGRGVEITHSNKMEQRLIRFRFRFDVSIFKTVKATQ
jgi:hypothetical protein